MTNCIPEAWHHTPPTENTHCKISSLTLRRSARKAFLWKSNTSQIALESITEDLKSLVSLEGMLHPSPQIQNSRYNPSMIATTQTDWTTRTNNLMEPQKLLRWKWGIWMIWMTPSLDHSAWRAHGGWLHTAIVMTKPNTGHYLYSLNTSQFML